MAKNSKRPVYMIVRYINPSDEEGPFHLIDIKQTHFTASTEAGKHVGATVKKGWLTG